MDEFLSIGRWLFLLPFVLFGTLHFMGGDAMANEIVPAYMPAKSFWLYLTGICLVAAGLSMAMGKYDKLATTLLAFFLLIMVFLVHMPNVLKVGSEQSLHMIMLLKDLALAGACLLYAKHASIDKSITG
jgi:uncharacterized membrane protein YphA (DoxX/SURF4 family)